MRTSAPRITLGLFLTVGMLLAGLLGSATAAQAAGCPTGKKAVRNLTFKLTAPNGNVRVVNGLYGKVRNGDTVEADFTVQALPAGCAGVELSLASYRSPFPPRFTPASRVLQILFDSATGVFGPGAHSLTMTVPPVPSGGNTLITVGPEGMEGALVAHPNEFLSVGYDFTMGAGHQDAAITFADPKVAFPYRCASASPVAGTFVASMPLANYSDGAGSTASYPSGNQADPSAYQGRILVPDVCSGGPVYLNYSGPLGATFTSTVWTTNNTADPVSVRFHYRDPAALGKGNIDCSDSGQNPAPGRAECGDAQGGLWSSAGTMAASNTPHFQVDLATGPVQTTPNYGPTGNLIDGDYEIPCPKDMTASGITIDATEGQPFTGAVTTASQPDPNITAIGCSATIAWGDGYLSVETVTGPAGGPFTVSGGHTYAEEGTYPATVTITGFDTKSSPVTATLTANVGDAALTAGALTLSASTEGVSPANASFGFTDANPGGTTADFAASIDWGDGSTSAGTVNGAAGGPFTVGGSHTYADEGSYTVKVQVLDDGGSSTSATGTATVADAALAATYTGSPLSPLAFNGQVATFTDANPNGPLSDFTASIDWGDSSTSAGTVGGPTGGHFTVGGSHAYASTGSYTVKVTVKDIGGSMATASGTLVIFAPPAAGNFVIGDRNSSVGTAVTFWGAQWWKLNSLSGGTAPASFKGFANRPSGSPSCGMSWATDPGNSSNPPAGPLPSYMAVIVSSSISKSGPTIAGNTPHVVVVKTDPGYDDNPGHAGTGTVVGVVC